MGEEQAAVEAAEEEAAEAVVVAAKAEAAVGEVVAAGPDRPGGVEHHNP